MKRPSIPGSQQEAQAERGQVIVTRKIEIQILEPDDTLRKEKYDFIFGLQRDVFRAANLVVNNQFYNLLFTNRLKDQLTIVDGESRILDKAGTALNLGQAKLIAEKLLKTSTQNSTYQIIGSNFPDMPSQVKSALNSVVFSNFKSDIKEILRGDKSIRNYRYGMPIPFNIGDNTKFMAPEDRENGTYQLTWLNKIKFALRFGRDKSNNRIYIDRILDGEYKFCDSSIVYDKPSRKFFLLLCVKFPKQIVKLDYDLIAATNLGMNCPLYLTTSSGEKMPIGDKEEFLNVRLQFQKRYRALQAALTNARAGHGRDRKLKALDRLRDTEKNFAKTYNHKLSKQIIQYCLKNGIGTIKTEDLLGGANTLNKEFILRNWGYFQLQSMIKYKADMYNITVVKVDAKNITRQCNCCGSVSEDAVNLKTRLYTCMNDSCLKYNIPVNIDENASLNVLAAPKKTEEKSTVNA